MLVLDLTRAALMADHKARVCTQVDAEPPKNRPAVLDSSWPLDRETCTALTPVSCSRHQEKRAGTCPPNPTRQITNSQIRYAN